MCACGSTAPLPGTGRMAGAAARRSGRSTTRTAGASGARTGQPPAAGFRRHHHLLQLKGGIPAVEAVPRRVAVTFLSPNRWVVWRVSLAHPASMTHAAMDELSRRAAGLVDGLLRLSVGIEGGGRPASGSRRRAVTGGLIRGHLVDQLAGDQVAADVDHGAGHVEQTVRRRE